ncbi:MAG: transposase [Chloroflexota bacterium]|nr:transposase [Chloroflexota bacterium]MDE2919619.1 transposase [Chloroflexota bacterium]
MHRQLGDTSFAYALLPENVGRNARLKQLAAVLDWEPVAAVVGDIYPAPEGRPSYPPLVLVKVLLLQQWYNASDPEIKAALWDRLSFRRFVGLSLQDPVPDHSMISRFRSALAARGSGECLFGEVTRQLDAAGFRVKAGTLTDATLVAAQAWRPSLDEGPGTGNATDPDAT